jgi:predicted 3-demethylubiquinone-9 3-methyltransferase (glyoxalase superfamily)
MKPVTPCLWFDTQGEEAAKFYVSVLPNSKVTKVTHYGEAGPMPKGTVMTVAFELNGQPFLALNGGPHFKHTPAVSFIVYCRDQDEIDACWEKLSAGGGEKGVCGWLTDKYGVSWQVTPAELPDLVSDDHPERSNRVMSALMQMKKLDIGALKRAYDQG